MVEHRHTKLQLEAINNLTRVRTAADQLEQAVKHSHTKETLDKLNADIVRVVNIAQAMAAYDTADRA